MIASDEDYKTLYPVILLLCCKVSPKIPNIKILRPMTLCFTVIDGESDMDDRRRQFHLA